MLIEVELSNSCAVTRDRDDSSTINKKKILLLVSNTFSDILYKGSQNSQRAKLKKKKKNLEM